MEMTMVSARHVIGFGPCLLRVCRVTIGGTQLRAACTDKSRCVPL